LIVNKRKPLRLESSAHQQLAAINGIDVIGIVGLSPAAMQRYAPGLFDFSGGVSARGETYINSGSRGERIAGQRVCKYGQLS
jgi:hypothetical protein